MSRRLGGIIALVGCVGFLTQPAATTGSKSLPCSKKGSRTIAASAEARVFAKGRSVFGCLYGVNRRFKMHGAELHEDPFYDVIGLVRLAGPFVAYSTNFGDSRRVDNSTILVVRDLRDGRTLHQWGDGPGYNAGPHSALSVRITDLELAPSGSVAWIREGQDTDLAGAPVGPPRRTVFKFDQGSETSLDSGTEIEPGSLAFSSSIVYWTKGGAPHSSTIDDSVAAKPGRTSQADPRCSLRRSKTVAANTDGRVFSKSDGEGGNDVYGCLYSRNRRVLLGIDGDYVDLFRISLVQLAGRFVGFDQGYAGRQGESTEIYVVNLHSGKRTFEVQAGPGGSFGDNAYSTDLELKPSGAVAWITAYLRSGEGYPYRYTVNRHDANGDSVVDESRTDSVFGPLGVASPIEPKSLARSGSILYWTKGGAPQTAPLN